MKIIKIFPIMLLFTGSVFGQTPEVNNPLILNDEAHPCVDEKTYISIEAEIIKNRKLLGLDKNNSKLKTATVLQWPIKPASTLADCDYYYISAFVDQDNTTGIKDWNCGSRTYNGHRGVDFVPWPFIWEKMDNNLVEVIAAAPGTIIAKVDGNPDRVCNGVGGGSNSNNYITIQHADGSTALYIHMKTGSLTTKNVGQTVTTGEYLGIIGSAGQSTGVHLHFEIRSDGTFANYIDPFYGTCNANISSSWWASQKSYTEPKIIKLSLHTNWPYMASCPNTIDTTYENDIFISNPGSNAIFYACTKHVLSGDSWNFRILNPDNSVFSSWSYTSASNRNTSTLGWDKVLPTNPGIYTYEGTFNSITCTKTFTIKPALGIYNAYNDSKLFNIFPNPNNGRFKICQFDKSLVLKNLNFILFNALGTQVNNNLMINENTEINLDLQKGIYFYKIVQKEKVLYVGKVIIN